MSDHSSDQPDIDAMIQRFFNKSQPDNQDQSVRPPSMEPPNLPDEDDNPGIDQAVRLCTKELNELLRLFREFQLALKQHAPVLVQFIDIPIQLFATDLYNMQRLILDQYAATDPNALDLQSQRRLIALRKLRAKLLTDMAQHYQSKREDEHD